jgi:hypothetical protein
MAMDVAMPLGGNINYMIWNDTNSSLLFSQTLALGPSNSTSFLLHVDRRQPITSE